MAINKEEKSFGMPWEKEYGYSQAVKIDNTIYVSGQVSHDDKGNIVGLGNMEVQMRRAYTNIEKLLAQCGATIDNRVTICDRHGCSLCCKGQMQAGGLFWQCCTGQHHCADPTSSIP